MSYRYKKTLNEFEFNTMNLEVESFCERNNVPVNKLFSMQLIIEELVTNIIKYGNRDGDKATIEIVVQINGEQIGLTISDNANAFNPLEQEEVDTNLSLEERDIGGLGLFLVRKKVKSLSYDHKDGFNVLMAVI